MKTGSNGLLFGQRWEGPEVKWYVKENVRDLGNVFFKTPKTVEGEIRAEVRLEERFFFFFFLTSVQSQSGMSCLGTCLNRNWVTTS